MTIYLDHAATSLLKPIGVSQAVSNAMRTMASPGRGSHRPALRAADTVLDCRIAAAELFHVEDPEHIVFTFNATHALNLAIFSLVHPGSRVLISGFEHNAVTRPLRAVGADVRIAGRRLFDRQALIDEFARAIPGVDHVVCTHVSNAFGYILPIREIAGLCRKHGCSLIVDASQSAGVLDVDQRELGADFIAMPGHKGLFGPQGTGLLLCGREGRPLLFGGSGSDSRQQNMPAYLPDRLEAGTQNACGIAGLLAGIRYVKEVGTAAIREHETKLLRYMCSRLKKDERIELFRGEDETQSGVLSLRCRGLDSETAAGMLGEKGVCVRGGLHCAPLAHESAGTLETGTVRFSFSPFNTEEEIETACSRLREMLP